MSNPLPSRFQGQVVLIAGATGGLGEAVSRRFGAEGATLLLLARNQDRLDALGHSLTATGCRVLVFSRDVNQTSGLKLLLSEMKSQVGIPEILVNCVGAEHIGPFIRISDEEIQRILAANLHGTLALTRDFGRCLFDNNASGVVVNIASIVGQVGFGGMALYGAAKSAVVGWTRCLAVEWAAKGIRVNAIVPGIVESPLFQRVTRRLTKEQVAQIHARHPLGLGQPEDVAAAAAFLASSDARWITGAVLPVDGGYSTK